MSTRFKRIHCVRIVSIPVWCDWMITQSNHVDTANNVSIPVWCDWMCLAPVLHLAIFTFQFQYGAIGCRWNSVSSLSNSMFQFQYGAIGCLFFKRSILFYHRVSIPVWCDWMYRTLGHTSGHTSCFNSSMVRLDARTRV